MLISNVTIYYVVTNRNQLTAILFMFTQIFILFLKITTENVLFADFNLCCLHDQLSSMEIQSILHMLENVCSPSVDSFQLLTLLLHKELQQAASNITYLNVLSEACNNLKCPGEIEKPMMRILFLILFIWTESSFYNLSYSFLPLFYKYHINRHLELD